MIFFSYWQVESNVCQLRLDLGMQNFIVNLQPNNSALFLNIFLQPLILHLKEITKVLEN
jgi:hypothetical protein